MAIRVITSSQASQKGSETKSSATQPKQKQDTMLMITNAQQRQCVDGTVKTKREEEQKLKHHDENVFADSHILSSTALVVIPQGYSVSSSNAAATARKLRRMRRPFPIRTVTATALFDGHDASFFILCAASSKTRWAWK